MPPADDRGEPVALHIERLPGEGAQGEVLAADRPQRRRSRRATAAWTAALALVAGGLLADRAQREREVEQLVDDVESTTDAVVFADTRAMLLQIYVRPVSSAGVTGGALTADLEAIVRDAELTGADELAREGRRLDDVTVLPWHTDVAETRDVLERYLLAQERRLRGDEVEGSPTAQDVADAARAAVPDGAQADRLEAVLDGIAQVRD